MGHSRFDPPRTEWIGGVKYVRGLIRVTKRDPDGEPRTIEIIREGETYKRDDDVDLAYIPSSWTRGAGK